VASFPLWLLTVLARKPLWVPRLFVRQPLQLPGLASTERPSAARSADNIRNIVFGGSYAVPITVVPVDLWNSEKLNNSLNDIDNAIDAHHYNRATTLSYTCIAGLYKAYIRKHVPE
jgi:hypothetical protein